MARYTLLQEDQYNVPQAWFNTQINKRHQNTTHQALRSLHGEEVRILKAYHDGELQPDAAAADITRPISTSPIPDLGGYSDDTTALCHLWELLVDALVEWPSSRTPDLVALLTAISKVPGQIHRGEALDDDEQPRLWSSIPFFTMVWSDAHWMQPGMITRRAPDHAARIRERDVYVKQQDVEAQLVAAGLFEWKLAFQYLISTLERTPGPEDRLEAGSDAEADGQLKLDFHVPAAARWIKHNARRLYDGLVEDELRHWHKRDVPPFAMHFEQPTERWDFWEKRFREIQRDESDDFTKEAAGAALESMQDVRGQSTSEK